MKTSLLPILFLLLLIYSCKEKKTISSLNDLMEIDEIEHVHLSNNSGSFDLNNSQIAALKKDLHRLTYEPNFSAKVGAIGVTVTIHGKAYHLSSSTHGNYVEAPSSIATKNQEQIQPDSWLYFNTNGVNFDNYTNPN